jgi:hypothetical protein
MPCCVWISEKYRDDFKKWLYIIQQLKIIPSVEMVHLERTLTSNSDEYNLVRQRTENPTLSESKPEYKSNFMSLTEMQSEK